MQKLQAIVGNFLIRLGYCIAPKHTASFSSNGTWNKSEGFSGFVQVTTIGYGGGGGGGGSFDKPKKANP